MDGIEHPRMAGRVVRKHVRVKRPEIKEIRLRTYGIRAGRRW